MLQVGASIIPISFFTTHQYMEAYVKHCAEHTIVAIANGSSRL
jgi:hypothetical protein